MKLPPPLPLPLPMPNLSQHLMGLFTSSNFEFNHQEGSFTTSGALLSHLRGSIGLDFIFRWGIAKVQRRTFKKNVVCPEWGKCEYCT